MTNNRKRNCNSKNGRKKERRFDRVKNSGGNGSKMVL